MNKKNLIIIGIILWILLGIICILIHAKNIENKLTARSQEQLKSTEFANLKVSFNGRDALLAGIVSSEAFAQKAEALIDGVNGVRKVKNLLELEVKAVETPEMSVIEKSVKAVESSQKQKPEIDFSQFQIYFVSDSYRLSNEAWLSLNKFQKILSDYSRIRMKILGHTDNTGTHEYNSRLSRKRAEAVKSYLVNQGILPERLMVVGLGETQPVADNATPEGRRKNRRVEFKFTEED